MCIRDRWRSSISNYIDMWGWRWTSRGRKGEKLCHDVSATNASQHQVHHADTKVDMDPSVVTVTKTFCCHCFNIYTNVDAAAAEMEDTEDQCKSLQGAHVHTTSLHWSRYTTGLFLLLYEWVLRSAIVNKSIYVLNILNTIDWSSTALVRDLYCDYVIYTV